jgi:hypothetical protein
MPILLPTPNIRSQIERAVRAYLTDCGVGTFTQFRLSHDYRERIVHDKNGNRVPLIGVYGISASEEIKNTRIESWQVRIDPEYDAATQPGENPNWNWMAINEVVGLIMSAMSQTSRPGANFLDTALMISVFGRRLAVLGVAGDTNADSYKDHLDMALFSCSYVEYTGALGTGKSDGGGLIFKEQRNFQIRGCNEIDDSVFPVLTFDGAKLNWTFTASGTWPEPAQWNVEKSVDGYAWLTHETHTATVRASNSIAGTGTQFWRVTRTDASIPTYMPESNTLKVTGA